MSKHDITIRQGKTFRLPVMWELDTLVYKPINGVEQSAPVRIQAVAHGIPDGWNVAVVNLKAPVELNAVTEEGKPPADKDFRTATKVSDDEIEFNKVNGAAFKAYSGGGQLVFYAPGPLAGAVVHGQIKDKIGGAVLHEFRSDGPSPNVTLDLARSRVILNIPHTVTAGFSWKAGVYDLELIDSDNLVYPLIFGGVTVEREVTTITA